MSEHPSSEPWRLACPEGHRSLERNGPRAASYRCHACGQTYRDAEITDVKTGRVVA